MFKLFYPTWFYFKSHYRGQMSYPIIALFHVITKSKLVYEIRKYCLEEPQEFLIFVLLHLSSYDFQQLSNL